MSSQTLAPDSVISQTGMAAGCTLSDVDESVDSPDANYCEASSDVSNTTLRVSFETPTDPPTAGEDLQKFRVECKRSGFASPPVITFITIALRETGGGTDLDSQNFNAPFNNNSFVKEFTWDSALLGTANGSKVECYCRVTHGSEAEGDASIDIGAIEWVEEGSSSVAGDIAVIAPKPTVAATATYTDPQAQFNADIAVIAPKPTVSAVADYTQQMRAGDIAVITPKPSVFAAAEFQPSGDIGTTGWIRPAGASCRNGSDSGVTISNVSNAAAEDANVASVNLQRTGGGTLQDSKRLEWNWVDPGNYDAEATVDGIEFIIYSQYDTENQDSHNIYPFDLAVGDAIIEDDNTSTNPMDNDSDPGPVHDNTMYFGSPTDLFGIPALTLVSDFLAQDAITDRNAFLKLRNDSGSGDTAATVLLGHVKMKVWWSVPNIIEMDSDISFSVVPSDTGALQKLRDLAASPSGSVTVDNNVIISNPSNVFSDVAFSVIIEPANVSEGTTDIDMDADVVFSVLPSDGGFDRLRNMIAAANFTATAEGNIGHEHGLDAAIQISVTMLVPLYRDVEMQTDSLGAWFVANFNPNLLEGNMALSANVPFSVVFDPDGILVNWALYANPVFSVTGSPLIGKMTNLETDVPLTVTVDAPLVADINIAAAVTIDGLLFNSQFIKLPVPTLDARIIFVGEKDRDIIVTERDRTLFVSRQQRNP